VPQNMPIYILRDSAPKRKTLSQISPLRRVRPVVFRESESGAY
jgi:hypothetical protein